MAWNQKAFGSRLRKLREQQGLSMLAFGKEIGTSASRIKHWEEGKSAPSASWIVTICERFDVSAENLLTGSNTGTGEKRINTPEHAAFGETDSPGVDGLVESFIRSEQERYGKQGGRERLIEEITVRLSGMSERDLRELSMLAALKEKSGKEFGSKTVG
ncbi:Helix-turn-helix domain-containing protein [Bhargavaea ginsengi]|uniref:Helix-turn-helix domain-containing protein n=1 Tax=Bhargavaea ginsengi TaxID=426757 RepID=A0A1H6XVX1_9BACL|nr:helix-turn-helix domain-containing protein [Bhargavaea ginsengi]MCM3086428.1 helix-turn-helix domain-containing protein [Bhargavaea ginsengi]SEJ30907.1 Helix-turn-helix domain-containing protein [Bhargavaea ginsengi]